MAVLGGDRAIRHHIAAPNNAPVTAAWNAIDRAGLRALSVPPVAAAAIINSNVKSFGTR